MIYHSTQSNHFLCYLSLCGKQKKKKQDRSLHSKLSPNWKLRKLSFSWSVEIDQEMMSGSFQQLPFMEGTQTNSLAKVISTDMFPSLFWLARVFRLEQSSRTLKQSFRTSQFFSSISCNFWFLWWSQKAPKTNIIRGKLKFQGVA